MNNFKRIKFYKFAFSITALLMFILVFSGSVFAAQTSEEILNSNCPKEDVSCMLQTSAALLSRSISISINITLDNTKTKLINFGSTLQSTSSALSSGWSIFTNVLLNNSENSFSTNKQLAVRLSNNLTKGTLAYTNIILNIPDQAVRAFSSTKSLAFSTTASVGSSLQSTSANLSNGWGVFINGIIDSAEKSVTDTKNLATTIWNNTTSGVNNFIALLKEPITTPKVVVPESLVTTKTIPNTPTDSLTLPSSGHLPLAGKENTNTGNTTVVKNITQQQRDVIINQYDPAIIPRIQGIEKALQNNITFNTTQTDRIYYSLGRSISSSSDNITEDGILNDSTLNRPNINNAIITTSSFSGTTGVYTGNVSALTFTGNLIGNMTGVLTGNADTVTNGVYTSRTVNGHPLSSDVTVTPTDLGLVIGTDVLAQRTFGTAADNNTEDFLAYNATAVNSSLLESHNALYFQTALTNPVTGTGTTNYLPKFSGTSTLSNSLIYDNGTNVGIGTTNPQGLLSIAGGDVYIDSSDQNAGTLPNGSVGPGLRFGGISTGEGIASKRTATGNQNGLDFYTSYINRMAITNTGNVGIGTTGPGNRLTLSTTGVDDTIPALGTNGGKFGIFRDALYGMIMGQVNTGAGFIQAQRIDGTATAYNLLLNPNGGNVGIGTTAPTNGKLEISDGSNTVGSYNAFALSKGSSYGTTQFAQFYNSGSDYGMAININQLVVNRGSGNVGIGTTNPLNKLHVEGTGGAAAGIYINSAAPASGTYTLYNNGGILYWNDNLLSTGSGSALTGSGVANYLSKWTSDSVIGTSSIYDNGTNVGIGTTSPVSLLDVHSSAYSAIAISSDRNSTDNNIGSLQYYGKNSAASNVQYAIIEGKMGSPTAGAETSAIKFYTMVSGTLAERMRIDVTGNVGIGTTAPGAKLQIGATALGTGVPIGSSLAITGDGADGRAIFNSGSKVLYMNVWNGANYAEFSTYDYNAGAIPNLVFNANGGNVGIGLVSPGEKLSVAGHLMVGDATWSAGTVTNGDVAIQGNVGIGTTGPGYKLDVNGTINNPKFNINTAAYSSYVADGLYGATASPSVYIPNPSNPIGLILFGYKDAGGGQYAPRIGFQALSPNTATKSSIGLEPTSGDFTINGGASNSEYMRILATNGNVGIGTTNPTRPLTVQGTISGRAALFGNNLGIGGVFQEIFNAGGNTFVGTDDSAGAYFVGGAYASIFGSNSATPTALITNGSAKLTILSGGNVGIGTTYPLHKLEVQDGDIYATSAYPGTGATPAIRRIFMQTYNDTHSAVAGAGLETAFTRIFDSDFSSQLRFYTTADNNPVQQMVIDKSGNVGIGTTGPGAKLEVVAGTATHGIMSTGGSSGWGGVFMNSTGGNEVDVSSSTYGLIVKTGNVGIGTVVPGEKLEVFNGNISIRNQNGAGNIPSSNGFLKFYSDSNIADANYWSGIESYRTSYADTNELRFYTQFGTPPAVRMTIQGGGNVGIGTTDPQGKLEINNRNIATGAALFIKGGTDSLDPVAGQYTGIQFGYGAGTTYNNAGIFWEFTNTTAHGRLNFAISPTTNVSATLADSKMTILENGNVGIGTTGPMAVLHVKASGSSLPTINGGTNFLIQSNGATGYIPGMSIIGGNTGGAYINFGDTATDGLGRLYYDNTSNSMILFTNQTEKVRIDISGNVGIGTTGPNAKLESSIVTTNADSPANSGIVTRNTMARFSTDRSTALDIGAQYNSPYGTWIQSISTTNQSVNYPLLLNPNGGNVGIGTMDPGAKLEVDGTQIRFADPGAVTSNNYSYFKTTATTFNTQTLTLGTIYGNQVPVDALSIYNGNVGIGTTNPIRTLQVSKAGAVEQVLQQTDGKADWRNWEFLVNGGNASTASNFNIRLLNDAGTSGTILPFFINGTTGNVGIGTVSPGGTLEVQPSGTSGYFRVSSVGLTNQVMIGTNTVAGYVRINGNLIPATDNEQNLGVSGYSWKNLSLSGNAIISGNVGIGTVAPTNLLTVGEENSVSNNIAPTLLVQGLSISDGGGNFWGSYGGIVLGANAEYTGGARRHLITNALGLTKFAIIRSTDSTTSPSMGVGGNIVSGTADFVIDNTGNVGIGTMAPLAKLQVKGTMRLGYLADDVNYYMDIIPTSIAANKVGYAFTTISFAGGTNTPLFLDNAGNVGIGTTNPTNILTIQQTSATDPIADAWTVYSSGRWKENRAPMVNALENIKRLNPVYFDWTAEHGGAHDLGFIAEEVGVIIPEVVAWEANGVDAKSIDYGRLSTIAIAGVKELNLKLESINTFETDEEGNDIVNTLRDKFIAWFANVGNGIGDIFAGTFKASDKLCINDTCVTESQLQELLANANVENTPCVAPNTMVEGVCTPPVETCISPKILVGDVCIDPPPATITLSSISITTPATKTSYIVNDTLDISGLVVTGTYSDASTKAETIIASNVTGFDSSSIIASQTLTITIGDKTATYTIEVK